MFQKYNKMLHGGAAAQAAEDGATGEGGRVELLTLEFIRKYIKYAKVRRHPVSCPNTFRSPKL